MKFMFCIATLTGGGAERVVSVISSALAEMGNETYILLENRTENEYPLDSRVNLLTVKRPQGDTAVQRKISRIMIKRDVFKQYNPEVVIAFLPTISEEAILAAKSLGIPTISTIRINPAVSPGNRVKRLLRDFFVAISTRCWTQTEEQKRYFPGFIRKKTFVLPNPVSEGIMSIDRAYSKNIIHFVSLGRMTKQKNYQMEIKAFQRAEKNNPGIRLDIYGEGEEKEKLLQLTKELGADHCVFIHDRTSDVSDVYQTADAFIMASDFEGMPNALMEAMASGLPCISTNCPTGPSDIISEPGENGILIDVGDENALFESIQWICNNPDQAKQMGICAHNTMKAKYSALTIAEDLKKQYLTVVRRPK